MYNTCIFCGLYIRLRDSCMQNEIFEGRACFGNGTISVSRHIYYCTLGQRHDYMVLRMFRDSIMLSDSRKFLRRSKSFLELDSIFLKNRDKGEDKCQRRLLVLRRESGGRRLQ